MNHNRAAQTDIMMITGKICVFGLLLLFTTVLSTSVADKPGECPSVRFLAETFWSRYNRCECDDNCEGNKKCCMDNGEKFCKSPAQERPGTCPNGTNLPRATDFCTSDSECPDVSKCCFNEGGKTCLPPVKEKMGSCPPKEVINCFVPMRSTCESDSTCPGDDKCCPSGCYKECLVCSSDGRRKLSEYMPTII
ncbi:perlwapin-like isoform X1 [Xenopus laevis]|uniref:Perlwapin-like isoform X1 n=2 Tax=Xenopus laevis TaxID=8355 RepID=A0A8J1M225_XENLA|nr:perlwapin-like isoform X1 [Xenopus laevis]